MKKNLIFLGIETSCDETAASVVMQDSKGKVKILSNVVSSQIKIHKKNTKAASLYTVCQIIQNFSQTAGQVAHKSYLSCVGICGDLFMFV